MNEQENIIKQQIIDEYNTYHDKSLLIRQDYTDIVLSLGKEYREWTIQLAVIGSAIIGAIVAFDKEGLHKNYLALSGLTLICVVVLLSLYKTISSLNKNISILQDAHSRVQKDIKSIQATLLACLKVPTEENYKRIDHEKKRQLEIKEKSPETKMIRDRSIDYIFILFVISLFLLLSSIIFNK